MTAELGAPSCTDAAPWSRMSPLIERAGFLHAFCHHGRPDDTSTCARIAPHRTLQLARQVHGAAVVRAWGWDPSDAPAADAVISAEPSFACAIRTADCAPVLLACAATGAVAAVHAGWRGIALGVIAQAIGSMVRECGARPRDMVAAVGPCARARRYEIGEDVAAAVAAAGCADAVARPAGAPKPFLDVARAAAIQLAAAGVQDGRIDANPPCSIESTWCPSHRRDPASGARMLSIIVPRANPAHG